MGGWSVDVTGALTVTDEEGTTVALRPKERAIVAAVALLHPEPATVADLVELIWTDPPDTARKAIHNHVARLRRTADGLVETSDEGYRLGDAVELTPPRSDDVFRDLVEHTAVAVARTRFRDARLHDEEQLAAAELGLHPDDRRIEQLARLADAEPHRMERWRLLVVGLARRGRRRDALDALRTARREAATSPIDHAELDRLERAVFDDDPRLGLDVFLHRPPDSVGPIERSADGDDVGLFIDSGGALGTVLQRLERGTATCLVVAGPAGSGKSTLCRRVRTHAGDRGWECHEIEARSHASATADIIGALTRSLRARRRHAPSDTPASSDSATTASTLCDPIDTCLELLVDDGRRRLVVVDDLHHASQDEARSLAALVSATATAGQVLWIIASRRDPELPGAEVLLMAPWDAAAVSRLLHRFVPRSPWTDGAAAWIAAEAGGNALAIRELAVDLVRRQRATTDEHGNFAPPAEPVAPLEWIQRRLDGLEPETRRALAGAAMVGVEFDLTTLGAFTDDPVGAITQARLDGIVTVDLTARQRYRFAHDLFREVLLDDLDDGAKSELALVALRDPMFDDDAESRRRSMLARLAVRDDPRRAVVETIAAGRLEVDRRHPVEAERLFRRAIEMMDGHAGEPDATLRTEASVELGSLALSNGRDDAIEILLDASERAARLGRGDLAVRAAYEASRVGPGSTVGTADTDVAAAIAACRRLPLGHADRTRLDIAEMSIYGIGTDGRRARELLDSALASAEASGDVGLVDVVHRSAFMSVLRPDDLARRRAIADHLRSRGEATGDLALTYEATRLDFSVAVEAGERDPRPLLAELERMHDEFGERSRNWSLFAFQTVVAYLDGDEDGIRAGIDRILSPETVVSSALKLSTAGGHQLGLHLMRGDVEVLDPLIARIEEDTPGLPAWVAARAMTAAAAGDHATARERLSRAHRLDPSGRLVVPDDFTGLPVAFLLGEAARLTGETDIMEAAVATLSPYCGLWLWHGTGTFGPVDLVLAEWAAAAGRPDDGRRLARAALDSAARVGSPHLIARAAAALARLGATEAAGA